MALPKEPRQKMINIMYLVLTALLAMNVSAEILNAFKTVERSLAITNSTMNISTQGVLASLEEKAKEPETRVKAERWLPAARQAMDLTKGMNDYIESLKSEIMQGAGFDPKKKGDSSFKEDDQDVATRILVEEGKGKLLQQKLADYKKSMMALVDQVDSLSAEQKADIKASVENALKQVNLDTPPSKSGNHKWEEVYFHMVPTVAATTILTKFQNDVKASENRVVTLFHEQVGKVMIRYDSFAAIVGQSSNYIMPGQQIEISAGVGAFSKAAKPTISIGGAATELGADGQAVRKVDGGALGKHTVPVTIKFMDQDGKEQTVNKTIEYTVGQSNASIALDKMNVLYIGVANPITVAASGGGDDKIQVSINGAGGSLQKTGAGKYNAFVTGGDKCTITVTVDGKTAGASEFRIRTIPTPTGTVGGYGSGDNVNAGAFKAQAGVGAYIKDFPFELKYTVTSFVISTDSDDGDIIEARVTGNSFANARNVIQQVKAGKTVYVDDIRAVGEDGKSRKLPSLVYYIK